MGHNLKCLKESDSKSKTISSKTQSITGAHSPLEHSKSVGYRVQVSLNRSLLLVAACLSNSLFGFFAIARLNRLADLKTHVGSSPLRAFDFSCSQSCSSWISMFPRKNSFLQMSSTILLLKDKPISLNPAWTHWLFAVIRVFSNSDVSIQSDASGLPVTGNIYSENAPASTPITL